MTKQKGKKQSFERRTSWEVVITYLFIIVLALAMLYYVYQLHGSVKSQRLNLDKQNRAMMLTKELTRSVHEAQSVANQYAFSDNTKYLRRFNELSEQIQAYSDSIVMNSGNEEDRPLLDEIQKLMQRKGQISYVLSRQLFYFNPLAEIDKTLDEYTPPPPESVYITKTIEDSIIQTAPKEKNFWQRLGNVFSPEKEDSIISITKQRIDTMTMGRPTDSVHDVFKDLRTLSEKAKTEYQSLINEYATKTNELIKDENRLSEQISTLLLRLNQENLDSYVNQIENSESIIEENIHTSSLIGAIVLGLIAILIIMILSDVNKGYRARRAAEEAQKKTEEIMDSRHKLLLSVSHDIKTPLTSIMGNVELMDQGGNEKEITSIKESADHILSLLTNLLDFSSLEQGKLQVESSFFNVSRLCEEIMGMFEPIASKKNLKFNFESDLDSSLMVNSDRLKIKQILSNLISNGIKYTLEGSVDFKASFDDGQLVFHVTDTGVGVPKEKIDEIFTPFVRIETYNTLAEGSGYGLSVVKGLVDLLDGTIKVDSEVGKGTHFEVLLPVQTEVQDTDASTTKIKSQTILVIDDDDTLLSVIGNMLQRLGHQCKACRSMSDIEEALQNTDEFDYILTDREMGALTGNDILHKFKEQNPDKPVLLMTARTEYNDEKAKKEGFDGLILKPFNMKGLEDVFGSVTLSDSSSNPETDLTDQNDVSSPSEATCLFSEDFPTFSEIMGYDEEAIRPVLNVFVQSTADDLMLMNNLIESSNFADTQALCHKMLPMFKQLDRDVTFLSKMNGMRNKKKAERRYSKWKNDAEKFMKQADELLDLLSDKYGIG